MDKRSAIIVALGLVAALVIGGVGFAMGMTGPAPSLASTRDPAPEVRTIRRTVTVHRPPASTTTAIGAATSEWINDGWDDEDDRNDEHESDGRDQDDGDHDGDGHGDGHDGDHDGDGHDDDDD